MIVSEENENIFPFLPVPTFQLDLSIVSWSFHWFDMIFYVLRGDRAKVEKKWG